MGMEVVMPENKLGDIKGVAELSGSLNAALLIEDVSLRGLSSSFQPNCQGAVHANESKWAMSWSRVTAWPGSR